MIQNAIGYTERRSASGETRPDGMRSSSGKVVVIETITWAAPEQCNISNTANRDHPRHDVADTGLKYRSQGAFDGWKRNNQKEAATYLGFGGSCVIVAVWRGAERSARSLVAGADASAFREVLLTLRLTDFDLLLLATASELLGFKGMFCLELSPAMLGNVTVGHVRNCYRGR